MSMNSSQNVGWIGFEFPVSRYCKDLSSAKFNLYATSALITDYSFTGAEESEISGTVTSVSSTDKKIAQTAANAAGGAAKNIVDKFAGKHLSDIGGFDFASMITSISTQDYGGAIMSGLKLLFGRSMSTTMYSTSDVRLTNNGTIELSGTSVTPTMNKILPLSFNMQDIISGRTSIVNPGIVTFASTPTRQPILFNLGTWGLKSKPVVYYDRITPFTPTEIFNNGSDVEFIGDAPYPSLKSTTYEIEFNPYIRPYITSYRVSIDIVDFGTAHNRKNSAVNATQDSTEIAAAAGPGRTKGFIVPVNPANYIYDNSSYGIYAIGGMRGSHACISVLQEGESITDETLLYYDWGPVKGGYNKAVVTVKMNINYLGHAFEVVESRIYDVTYKEFPYGPSFENLHRPPHSYVINNEFAWNYGG